MHEIVSTEGIIIKSFPRGEADKLYVFFTRDLGVIHVLAQGIRKKGSKLAPSVDEFSHGNFSLVKTKNAWRLVGAEANDNFFRSIKINFIFRKVRNILYLISDTCEENIEDGQEIFDKTMELFNFFKSVSVNNLEKLELAEMLFLVFFLTKQGIMPYGILDNKIINDCSFDPKSLDVLYSVKDKIVQSINIGIKELIS
jgi:DNA repair protein RecO